MEIGFIGLGKLGLDCAEVFSKFYTVRGFDIYPRTSGSVEICSLEDTVQKSSWIFIAVPTPHDQGYDGSAPSSHLAPKDFDYAAVIDTLTRINNIADSTKNIVLISTVLPGTCRKKFSALLDPRHNFLYNPYLIAMGSVKYDMVHPEMVMIGGDRGDDSAIPALIDIYRPLMSNDPRYVTGTWEECESIKIFYNTFISFKIGMANMIQDFAMKIGNINVDVVTDALARSTLRIMGPKYMTAGMGDAGACHPRDNIALRWLAQEYDLGYDMFDTIMRSREHQAQNLADFLCGLAVENCCPIVIHGKAYKPDVPYCIGSYSTLVAHYIKQRQFQVHYVDPLADDDRDVIQEIPGKAVILMAHNRRVTYGYTDLHKDDRAYCTFSPGSIIVDPWRTQLDVAGLKVIHYGNTRI